MHSKGALSGALLLCLSVPALWQAAAAASSADVSDASRTHWIKRVPDGDSLILHNGSKVRLIGINAPEFGKKGRAHQPLARQARTTLSRLTQNKKLILLRDNDARDRYQRLLMHAYLADGRNLQEILLREGLAWHVAIPPNLENLERYRKAEAEARTAARGVWRPGVYPTKSASKLGKQDTGFHLVQGKIDRHWENNGFHFFALSPDFTLRIPHADWHHFAAIPAAMLNKPVIARGWISERQGKLSMRLGHPAMLEFTP